MFAVVHVVPRCIRRGRATHAATTTERPEGRGAGARGRFLHAELRAQSATRGAYARAGAVVRRSCRCTFPTYVPTPRLSQRSGACIARLQPSADPVPGWLGFQRSPPFCVLQVRTQVGLGRSPAPARAPAPAPRLASAGGSRLAACMRAWPGATGGTLPAGRSAQVAARSQLATSRTRASRASAWLRLGLAHSRRAPWDMGHDLPTIVPRRWNAGDLAGVPAPRPGARAWPNGMAP